ncbi:BMC domain-containing protein [Thermoanaerobacterium butyriciformans]
MHTGELAAVEASINAGCKALEKLGMLLNKSIIPNPDRAIWDKII